MDDITDRGWRTEDRQERKKKKIKDLLVGIPMVGTRSLITHIQSHSRLHCPADRANLPHKPELQRLLRSQLAATQAGTPHFETWMLSTKPSLSKEEIKPFPSELSCLCWDLAGIALAVDKTSSWLIHYTSSLVFIAVLFYSEYLLFKRRKERKS